MSKKRIFIILILVFVFVLSAITLSFAAPSSQFVVYNRCSFTLRFTFNDTLVSWSNFLPNEYFPDNESRVYYFDYPVNYSYSPDLSYSGTATPFVLRDGSIGYQINFDSDLHEFYYLYYDLPSVPDTPTLSINGRELSWSNVGSNVEYQLVYLRGGNTPIYNGSATSYTLTNTTFPQYENVYMVRAKFSDSDEWSEWSNQVAFYYDAAKPTCPQPQIQYMGDMGFKILNESSYYSYKLYLNGEYLKTIQGSDLGATHVLLSNQSGTLYVVSTRENYYDSQPSNSILVGTSVSPDKPGEDSTILDWLKFFINTIEYWVDSVLSGVGTLFENAINGLSMFGSYITNFFNAFGNIFDFMPYEIRTVLFSAISIVCLLGVFNFFIK